MAGAGFARTRSSLEGENPGVTVIAVDMGKNSNFAVKWAADNLLKKGPSSSCILLHVHNKPPPTQNQNGPSQKEMQQLFLPFRGFCARKGVRIQAQEVVLFDTDIAKALLEYIAKNSIGSLVIGATNKSAFSRKFWSVSLSTTLIQAAPDSCSVYVISKGKVQSMRLANQPPPPLKSSSTPPSPYHHNNQFPPPSPDQQSDVMSMSEYSYSQGSLKSDFSSDRLSIDSSDSAAIASTRISAGNRYGRTPAVPPGPHHGKVTSRLLVADSAGMSNFSDSSAASLSSGGMPRSIQYVDAASYESSSNNNNSMEFSGLSASSSGSANSSDSMQYSMEAEIRRLRLELQQTLDAYHSICKDPPAANQTMSTKPQNLHSQESDSNMSTLDLDFSTADMELQRNKAARITQLLSEMEAQKKQNAETRGNYKLHGGRERNHNSRSMESLTYNYGMINYNNPSEIQFRKFNIQDIELATNYFAQGKKIGEGGYGPVYKGTIDDVAVAIKVVRPDLSQGQKQFQKEVEVLSTVRHPHMVNLLGACPQYGCLVYEYMDNGSLEDRLFRKDNTPAIPWWTRFKIASEIATGLLYLHQHKPEPIVHRDLKPANILLDSNYVSKIGDVGLARLVPGATANSNVTRYHVTAAAGTFCYIDPEYQQTGLLSVKSDLFSLGVVLLQLITGRTPMGLSYQVEEAVENDRFSTVLDPTVKDWPVEEALSLVKVALQCCELRKKDRPSLENVVLPELNRLKDIAAAASTNGD